MKEMIKVDLMPKIWPLQGLAPAPEQDRTWLFTPRDHGLSHLAPA